MPERLPDNAAYIARQRMVMFVLLALLAGMAVVVAGCLWMVIREARQLGHPTSHGELWQAYQIRNAMGRLVEEARSLEGGGSSPSAFTVRLGVLRSLTRDLSDHPMFAHLPQPRPDVNGTLRQVEQLSIRWQQRASWEDRDTARQLAGEVIHELPPLQLAMHEVMVAANISLANELDGERQHLYRYFHNLAWALCGLLGGGSLLMLQLVRNYRRERRLAERLGELNQSLEARVDARTRELRQGRELLRDILEASPSDVALIGTLSGKVHFVTQRLLRRHAWARARRVALEQLFTDPEEAQRFRATLESRGELDDWEARLGRQQPYWGVISGRLVEVDGEPAYLVWSYDITPRKRLEQELLTLATTDALTGLGNRRAFMQRAGDLLRQQDRFGHPCCLLMMDLDHFKAVNDQHGHSAGDEALQAAARAMTATLREVDVLGRLGGEEFAALLPEATLEAARQVAERLRSEIEGQCMELPDGQALHLTVSLGLAQLHPGESLESLLGRADKALYAAKLAGRNRVEQAV